MNTIYEDLGEHFPQIKSKIRIKKVVKQQDSDGNEVYTLQASSLLDDSFILADISNLHSDKTRYESLFASALSNIEAPNSQPKRASFSNFERRDHEKNSFIMKNKRFPSIETKGGSENSLKLSNRLNQIIQKDYNNEERPKKQDKKPEKQGKEGQKYSQPQLFHSGFPDVFLKSAGQFLAPSSSSPKGKMFRSHSENNMKKGNFTENFSDLKEFMLPRDVLKVIAGNTENLKRIRAHVASEKLKIDQELNDFQEAVNSFVYLKKRQLFKRFDDYLSGFEGNYSLFLEKVKVYREQTLKRTCFPGKKIRIPVKEVAFWLGNTKLNSEKCPSEQDNDPGKLDQEMKKKELLFFSGELNKQLTHMPLFNYSEFSKGLFVEGKEAILGEIRSFCDSFDSFVYENAFISFRDVDMKIRTGSAVLDDNLGVVVGNISSLNEEAFNKIEDLRMGKGTISTLLVFDDKMLVTGDLDGHISVWDAGSFVLLKTLYCEGSLRGLSRFEACEEEIKGKNNLLKSFLMKTGLQTTKLLVSLAKTIRIWDLNTNTVVRELINSHPETITVILATNDGKTLISGFENGYFSLWDTTSGRENQQIIVESSQAVNCMFLMRDQSRCVSGGADGVLRIWRLSRFYCVKSQRKVIERMDLEACFGDMTLAPIYSINQGFYNENLLVTGGYGTLKVWDLKGKECRRVVHIDRNQRIAGVVLMEGVCGSQRKEVSVKGDFTGECGYFDEDLKGNVRIYCCFSEMGGQKAQVIKKGDGSVEFIEVNGENIRRFGIVQT